MVDVFKEKFELLALKEMKVNHCQCSGDGKSKGKGGHHVE